MSGGFVALGLVQGALAALNALGLVLLWRTTRVINLAQPAMGLVGGVLTGMLVSSSGWSFWWAAPLGVVTGAALGFTSERLVMVRLAGLPRTVPVVATIGLAGLFLALQSGIPFMLGGRLPSYDVDIGIEVFVFPVLLKGPHLLALAVLPIAMAGLWWFVHRSRPGSAAVAAGQDLERAQTLGVDTGYVRALSWSVAGALSGVAGVLSVPVLGFSLGDGVAPTVLLLAVAPAVLAGLRSLPGTVAASLAVGVGYQFALVEAPTAGMADILLAVVIVVALLVRPRELARQAGASRASSWAAATDAPPVSRAVRRDPRWRRLGGVAAVALVVVAALPPLWLSPSGDVRYGTTAALALAAVAAATAWMFSGEIAVGHWGLAALGATAAWAAPGPLAVRVACGLAAGVIAGLALAVVGERRGGLTTAVAGLALAVAAPYWLVRAGSPSLGVDVQLAAVTAGAVAAGGAVAIAWLRGRRLGLQMVAARDDRHRSAALGIGVVRSRLAGMGLSGGLAAAAGVVYLASVPAGVAPGAFDSARSLDVLAFAVVGGLGSALGAGLGAAVLVAAGIMLPAPWASVASGFGVLWVVLAVPGGLGVILSRGRDWLARVVCSAAFAPRPDAPARGDGAEMAVDDDDEPQAIAAGADTREALRTPAVRMATAAAFSLAAPSLAAFFGAPAAMRDHLGIDLGGLAPWFVLGVGAVCAALAAAAWRRPRPHEAPGLPSALLAGVGTTTALVAFVVSRDRLMVTVLLLAAPLLGTLLIARLAKTARSVVVPRTRSAAVGVVVAAAVTGSVGAGHLAAVSIGNDILDAARWATLYVLAGTIAAATAMHLAPGDGDRSRQRAAAVRPAVGRRHWAPLRVEGLTVDFGRHRILDGVDLEVRGGEVVGLVGGNGAGKSTLLRAVGGLVEPVAGRVDVAGQEITALRADERAAVGLALVSGARPVFPDLSVRENLRVGAFLTHRTRRSFTTALDHVLALAPVLAGRLDARAGVLSGGEQRQLAIAQTLFRRPTVLLADEVALGLDDAAQDGVLGLLRTLADDGMGVVIVDHDLDALAGITDRFVVVHEGKTSEFPDYAALTNARHDLLYARFLARAAR